MRACWYERTGAARDVLVVGEVPRPEPEAGEVRVRIVFAGINPADVKRRSGAGGRTMPAARVIPGDDGAGVIDAVGAGIDPQRVGERVWVYAATAPQALGTAAEYVVVPSDQAVALPGGVGLEAGACLGIPAMTAHRALLADGSVRDQVVLVTGGAGAVGRYAIQLARNEGARVLATASTSAKAQAARDAGAEHVVDYRAPDAADRIRSFGGPVDRVIDVAFGQNLPLTGSVVATGGTIAAYGSDAEPQPRIPFYPLMRRSVTLRLISVFAMPPEARRLAIRDITRLLAENGLQHAIAARFGLGDAVVAHDAIEQAWFSGRVLLTIEADPALRRVRG